MLAGGGGEVLHAFKDDRSVQPKDLQGGLGAAWQNGLPHCQDETQADSMNADLPGGGAPCRIRNARHALMTALDLHGLTSLDDQPRRAGRRDKPAGMFSSFHRTPNTTRLPDNSHFEEREVHQGDMLSRARYDFAAQAGGSEPNTGWWTLEG